MRRSACGLHGHLLVGDDDAVHVGGQAAVAGRPLGLEVQVEAAGGARPLELEVLGGRHHDRPAARGARPRCWTAAVRAKVVLPAPGRGHREEVRPLGGVEAFEGLFLPGPEADGTRHRRTADRTGPTPLPRHPPHAPPSFWTAFPGPGTGHAGRNGDVGETSL